APPRRSLGRGRGAVRPLVPAHAARERDAGARGAAGLRGRVHRALPAAADLPGPAHARDPADAGGGGGGVERRDLPPGVAPAAPGLTYPAPRGSGPGAGGGPTPG